MSFLNILFPKKCINCSKFGSYLCTNCFSYISFIEHNACFVCQRQAMLGLTHPGCYSRYAINGVFSSLVYTGVVKKLIYSFKYPPYLTNLQSLLTDLFYEGIIQKEAFMRQLTNNSVLMPIPLHASKLRKRGYNHSLLLAKGIAGRLSLPIEESLIRVKNTKTQFILSQDERQENIRDAFALPNNFSSNYKNVILVDDIVTSGATLKEAAKVLKKAGVEKVWGITLAHGK